MIEDKDRQEQQYLLPYHWFIRPDTFRGRYYFSYLKMAMSLAGDLKDKKVLDAGCGDAFFCNMLLKEEADVYGADYSERAISFAKNLLPKVNFIKVNLFEENLPENNFDFIFAIEILEHIPIDKVVDFLVVLKNGLNKEGSIILTTPSKNVKLNTKHFQHFDEETIRTIAKEANLQVDKIKWQNDLSKYKKIIYKFLDNRFYDIKPLSRFYNLYIYPRWQAESNSRRGGRLVVKLSLAS